MYNECRHIFTSGKKCQSPALRDQNFCDFHQTNRRPTPKDQPYEPYIPPQETALALGALEDADAIQLALSDIVLALAANRIDSRRARILIYGLQVASQNNRHRVAMAAKDTVPAIVRETHEHEDGTLIAPPKQTPDPEEIPEKRRPSLGEILLREAEAMKAEREAERQAQQEAAEANQPVSITLPQLQAAADTLGARGLVLQSLEKNHSKRPQQERKHEGHTNGEKHGHKSASMLTPTSACPSSREVPGTCLVHGS
jgi:hypothetical protein